MLRLSFLVFLGDARQCSCDELEPCIANRDLGRRALADQCSSECQPELTSGRPSDVASCFLQREMAGFDRLTQYRQCLAQEGNLPCSPLEGNDLVEDPAASASQIGSLLRGKRRKRSLSWMLNLPADLRRFEMCKGRCMARELRSERVGENDAGPPLFPTPAPFRGKRSVFSGFLQLADYISCSQLANCSLAIETPRGFSWTVQSQCQLPMPPSNEAQQLCDCLRNAGVQQCTPPDWDAIMTQIGDVFRTRFPDGEELADNLSV